MRPLIVLTGPTAVGKTALSLELAKAVGGEILSADSMQVYRGMDIGSAKIRPGEMQGIPHHLIDVLDASEEFNVVVFQKLCRQAMEGIYERGHIPILTGGTGFYIQAVLRDIDFTENEENTDYRRQLEQLAAREGPEALHEMLKAVDPTSAQAIHAHNIKRTIRALEFHHLTGEKISEHNEREAERQSPYRYCYFVLNDDREKLYRRIEERVDQMREVVQKEDGVIDIDDMKTRLFGDKIYVDVEFSADGRKSLEESHDIAERVHAAIEREFPAVKHCMVHVNPYHGQNE